MTRDVHADDAPEPAGALLDAARRATPAWVRSITLAAAVRSGVSLRPDDPELERVVAATTDDLLASLSDLLDTDVDAQRTNPLSLYRDAVGPATELLLRRGARPPAGDRFATEHFPDDPFGLGPATWSDIDPELHEPGLMWGAWKAMTVLRRRRDEGRR